MLADKWRLLTRQNFTSLETTQEFWRDIIEIVININKSENEQILNKITSLYKSISDSAKKLSKWLKGIGDR